MATESVAPAARPADAGLKRVTGLVGESRAGAGARAGRMRRDGQVVSQRPRDLCHVAAPPSQHAVILCRNMRIWSGYLPLTEKAWL